MRKKNTTSKASASPTATNHFFQRCLTEGCLILVIVSALFIFISLWTYHERDPAWSHSTGHPSVIHNIGGQAGAYLADTFYWSFGYFAFWLPIGFVYLGWVFLKEQYTWKTFSKPMLYLRAVGMVILLIGACGLLTLHASPYKLMVIRGPGGMLGQLSASMLAHVFNAQGAVLLLFALFLAGMTWLTGLSWLWLMETIGRLTWELLYWTSSLFQTFIRSVSSLISKAIDWHHARKQRKKSIPVKPVKVLKPSKRSLNAPTKFSAPVIQPMQSQLEAKPEPESKQISKRKTALPNVEVSGSIPALQLLDMGEASKPKAGYSHQELETLSRDVEQHLLDFGIQADVVAVHPGPVITRFELQLAAGVKASRLTALSRDLARSLSVTSVRVVEIIPGKTVVGIELPNQDREMVHLFDVLSADVYQQAHAPLSLALGVDIAGYPMVVDLAKMPHLLVAGTTGSGKSVGINAMILSLLFKASPSDVRLILVDPKMLELSVYDGIPHLLTPVVTDMNEAASVLRWCVNEMERRYRLMAAFGVRNLVGFNAKVADAAAKGQPLTDPLWKSTDSLDEAAPELETLPYVVVVIDELADMMMVVGKKVEQLIARIAQKARAAGIHLILATQRPSVDVLTGLIKSNIPTRISFQVSSKIDSRTILDQQGAEQLLGHGDMLFLAPGTGSPLRVHGAFVGDKEVHRVAEDWRSRGTPEYLEDITQLTEDGNDGFGGSDSAAVEDSDPLYDEAVAFVVQTRKASISAVQRRFKIGYNRSARLIDEMERTGIVSPMDGMSREVLVNNS